MIVITNNPKVRAYFNTCDVQFVDGNYEAVLIKTRDLVHQNYKLLTHPLSGSVKPNETPYKSVALEVSNTLDVAGLLLIENAIEVYGKLQKDARTPNWTERILSDFMVIDFDLFKNAVVKSI